MDGKNVAISHLIRLRFVYHNLNFYPKTIDTMICKVEYTVTTGLFYEHNTVNGEKIDHIRKYCYLINVTGNKNLGLEELC